LLRGRAQWLVFEVLELDIPMAFIRHLKPSNPEVGLGARGAATRSDTFGTLEAALAEPVPEGYICDRIVDANGAVIGPLPTSAPPFDLLRSVEQAYRQVTGKLDTGA
jgi:hypothetical protein